MQIIKEISDLKKIKSPLAIALGNFDGVHKGHQALLHKCINTSRENGWSSSVLLWHPHPAYVVQRDNQQLRFLNTLEQKYNLFKLLGINYLFCLPFDLKVASLSPHDFVQEYLVDIFRVKEVFVGFNYSFGKKGCGTPELLQDLGKQKGFKVSITEPVVIEGQIVSSSLIRQKYAEGDMYTATKLLGYYPTIEGKVVSGERRGRELGYPTANIEVSPLLALPSFGVYVAIANYNDQSLPSVVNIGSKPTFNGKMVTVEVYLLDFKKNIYQENLKISLLEKIRSERKFKSKEELQAQIGCDIQTANKILKKDDFNLR